VRFDIITIFPRMFDGPLGEGIVHRAIERGLVDVRIHDLRDHATDRHRTVDDVPFGGGPGMVFKPEPMFRAIEAVAADGQKPSAVILTTPQGRTFCQAEAARLAKLERIVVICGRYEGVDERVRQALVTDEISVGDYVVSGGELPALVMVDAVVRLLPGAVGDEQSVEADSFSRGLLDFPHYTRPAEFKGLKVPDVLVSGHHELIRRWRVQEAVRRTLERRPDLLSTAVLDNEEREILRDLLAEKGADHGRD
jgi:tRNA (guanine37-N1)-methyltransferase